MPLSPTATREQLRQLEHPPNKKLGQNFLVDGNIVRKSVELADLHADSSVVEVGPGLGTLTQAILDTGAEVWAVERDAKLATHLRNQLANRQLRNQTSETSPDGPRLHLTEGDCLDWPLAGLPEERAAHGYKIVANLPYAVSTPWMDAVLAGQLPERMVLMLQKEAGDRYAAKHGSKTFGAISIFLQSAFEVHSKHLVSAHCFHPAPKVDSILLRLDRKADAVHFSKPARDCIRRIFTQRRKQLGALCKRDSQPEVLAWFEDLVKKGTVTTVRPEDLPLAHWQGLSRRLTGEPG